MNVLIALFVLTIGRFDLGFTYGIPTGDFANQVKSGFEVGACYTHELWQGLEVGFNGTAYNFSGLGNSGYRVSYESIGLTFGAYPFALLGYDGIFLNVSYNLGSFSRLMYNGKESKLTAGLIANGALKLFSAQRMRFNLLVNYGMLFGEKKNIAIYGVGFSFTLGHEEE